ncbi:MAG: metallophosphoesterase [Lachnospiraceae bacterium]|nr:metallophosphoesterase [Lachnospiraceae bacterium]
MSSFQTEHYTVRLPHSGYETELPKRTAVVSDLHSNQFGPDNRQLMHAILKEKPDLVLIPGDLITAKGKDNRVAFSFIKELAANHLKTCISLGNHEERLRREHPDAFEAFRNSVKREGLILLDNEWFSYSEHVRIGGLTIPFECYNRGANQRKLSEEEVKKLLPTEEGTVSIVMAHNPEFFDTYCCCNLDLIVSGHLHGGFIRLPFAGGLISPSGRFFPKYDNGIYEKNDSVMAVSRGLGDHVPLLRVLNKPELMILHLQG